MHWMILPLKRYADFEGRSRRMEFWMYQLFYVAVSLVFFLMIFAGFPWGEMMDALEAERNGVPAPEPEFGTSNFVIMGVGGVLYLLFWLGTLVPGIAVAVRRLHDQGYSGWWYGGVMIGLYIPLVNMLAILGYLVLLVFFCLPGTRGPNRFGDDPKDPGNAAVFE